MKMQRRKAIAAMLVGGLVFPSSFAAQARGEDRTALFLAARTGQAKRESLKKFGGTEESEAAVNRALNWLAEHRLEDGGWSFNHHVAPRCDGRCSHCGTSDARNAATGLALLPFLAAGHSTIAGEHRETVAAGVAFLVKRTGADGNLTEPGGSMYAQGIATQALVEAHAMCQGKDADLAAAAQRAVTFVVEAQDPVGGGWRYLPRQSGDTSVTGWQVPAVRHGSLAGLKVPDKALADAMRFLDAIQADDGAAYGYTSGSQKSPSMTASGLLCRLHGGWKSDDARLQRGVAFLETIGPSKSSQYFNYYATQVLFQAQGDGWKRWNERLRDSLIESQSKDGHERGSWLSPTEPWSEQAGRLYATSLATLMLEAYYRYPLTPR